MKNKALLLLLYLLTIQLVSANERTKIIAHRGYWKCEGSAQNSIKSLELANEVGVYGAEFDVHITLDNIPVIFHDNEVNGIKIQKVTYQELQDIKLANGEKIPTLEEYLTKGKELPSTKLILELKSHETPVRNCEAATIVVKMVNDMGLKDRTEYITFNLDAGKEFIRLEPNASIAYLNGDLSPSKLKTLGFSGLDYHYKVMNKHPEWFIESKNLGLMINVWTVNDPQLIKTLKEQGANFITTDEPVSALEIVATDK